jgi:cellulose synthase/poly-beta-1,6-N-acetylglucosamine synthase-like glycosyltransferase
MGWLVMVSALYWLAQAVLAARTRLALRTLSSLPEPQRTSWPTVSIIIPARDEGAHVRDALVAKLCDGYPALEVVLVDDRSTDDTGAQASALHDSRLTVTRVDALPEGWLGKVNALQQGLAVARGDWILFSDADVHLAPGTLTRLIAWAEADRIDHITALPKIIPGGPGVTLALVAFFRAIVSFSLMWKVEQPQSKVSAGVGAFNLFRRSALDRSEGLAWLKMDIADDMALGLLLKRSGARQRVVVAQEAISLEFYPSLRVMAHALEKNGATAPAAAMLFGLALLTSLELGYLGALLGADARVQGLGLLTWLLAATTQWGVCHWMRLPTWPTVFPGLGIIPLSVAMARSALLAWRQGGVKWRGTFYSTAVVRAGARLKP